MTFPSTPPADPVASFHEAFTNTGNANCPDCRNLSHRLGGALTNLALFKGENEVLRDRVSELDALVATATGMTVEARQHSFIHRLQEIDRTQRQTIAWQGRDIADLITERDTLRKALTKNGVDLSGVREHTVRGVNWAAEVEGS